MDRERMAEVAGAPREGKAGSPVGFRKLKAEAWENYLAGLAAGKRRTFAARDANIDYSNVCRRRKVDPEFVRAEAEAEEAAADAVEDVLWAQANAGNFPAVQMWLERRARERWSKPADRLEVGVQIEAGPALEQVQALWSRLEERRALLEGAPPPVIDAEVVEDS